MLKEVKITVSPEGKTQTEFTNFEGLACLTEAEKIRQALASRFGIKVEELNFVAKPELARENGEQVQQERKREQL